MSISGPATARLWGVPLALFAVGLGLRALFVHATPDSAGPFSPFYKGDAALWFEAVASERAGEPFELGLPLRPPATRWLVGSVWDGTAAGFATVRWLWILLGALWAPLTWWALRPVHCAAALGAALACMATTAALHVAASPNSEAPYLLLATVALGQALRIDAGSRRWAWLSFGALHGVAALFRAEHLLAALLIAAWVLWRVRSPSAGGPRRADPWICGTLALLGLVAVRVPVVWHAHRTLTRFNAEVQPPLPPPTMAWDASAREELAALPGFTQAAAQRFVEANLRHRGAAAVRSGDLDRLHREAFGQLPEPLATWPLLGAVYGPLNFALAHAPAAEPGFSRAALDVLPSLEGGAAAWDPQWLASLPRGGALTFSYPPHLQLVNHGYRLGIDWILADPLRFLERAALRLLRAAEGAVPRVGGYGLPVGGDGLRPPVDLTVPRPSVWWILFAGGSLAAAGLGWSLGLRRTVLVPWLLWAFGVAVAVVGFFGYARQGLLWTPLVGAGLGALSAVALRGARRPVTAGLVSWGVLLLAATLLALEGLRWWRAPVIHVDGAPAGVVEPFDPAVWQLREIEQR